MPRFYKLPREFKLEHDVLSCVDKCVPDQALSIPELLDRYAREQKPLPEQVDYDCESLEKEYSDLTIPEKLSRADALHFMDLTKAHIAKLEYHLRNLDKASASEVSSEAEALSTEQQV